MEICDTIKFNDISSDAIKLRFFPFSLRDKVKVWLNSHASNNFAIWAIYDEHS